MSREAHPRKPLRQPPLFMSTCATTIRLVDTEPMGLCDNVPQICRTGPVTAFLFVPEFCALVFVACVHRLTERQP